MTEQPELFEPPKTCPHKGCRRTATGPVKHGLSDHYVCSAGHESIERQGPK